MKKRIRWAAALVLIPTSGFAQLNVQLHYDLGHGIYDDELASRPCLTATIENFTADKWGSTYFFVDADLADNSMMAAYGELSRELRFWKAPVAAHVEYNGGVSGRGSYNDAYLLGAAYNWNSRDFRHSLSFQALYKYLSHRGSQGHSWQLTGVWHTSSRGGLCTFSGFFDMWHDLHVNGNLIICSEPQFWLNLWALRRVPDTFRLSVGTEVELSNNFVYPDGEGRTNNRVYAIPTMAVKWTF